MTKYTSKTVKAALIIVAMLAMVAAVYAVFPENPSQGDYWYNYMAGTGRITYLNGWNYYDGTQWVAATTCLADQPQPFTKNIYLSNTVWLDADFILAGNMISNPEDPTRNIRVTVKGNDRTFTLTETGSVTTHSFLIVDNATFINKGTVNLPYTDADSKFIVEYGTGDQTGGHLDNYGTINISGLLHCGYESSIASHEGGVIQGPGRMQTPLGPGNVPYSGDIRVSIANEGGWDAAFQLEGGCNVAPLNLTFNGEADQVTGANLPQPVYRLTVDSGHTLTLSGPIEVEGTNNTYNERPDVTVKNGSTLDLGEHVISSQTTTISGVSKFILEEGATIKTAHPDGISSVRTNRKIGSGAIQLNHAEYSSGANYIFSGTGTPGERQNSGEFVTTPNPSNEIHVNNIINLSDDELKLHDSFYPLYVDGGYHGLINTNQNVPNEGYIVGQPLTLPVEMSYFSAVFNGFNSVTLQWETQSETNNLGFYVLRSDVPDAVYAKLISELISAANTSQGAVYSYEDKDLYDDGVYYYWLQDISFAGEAKLHGPTMVQVTLQSGANQTPDIPLKTGLVRNYPNPFNPSTQLEYYLEKGSDVDFKVYNMRGQIVDQFTLRHQDKGLHRYTWQPKLSSGSYLIKFSADGKSNTRKVILSK